MNYEDFKNRNMNQKVLKIIFGVIGSILILKFFYRLVLTVFQYVFMSEKNLKERYGTNTWVMVTGPSGGIGKQLALKFAKRGFNICLVGNKKCTQVQSDIKKLNNNVQTHWIEADFSNENAYDHIETWAIDNGTQWAILINNVGYRVGGLKYEELSWKEMRKSINVGTIPQSRLIQFMIKHSVKTKNTDHHRAIINITALCQTHTDLFNLNPILSLPYLATYEASNAYGFYHSESVRKELKDRFTKIDYLTITPGAVLTENTKKIMNPPLAVESGKYAENIIKLLGNKNGVSSAYWGHSLISSVVNVVPFISSYMLKKVSKTLATNLSALQKSSKFIVLGPVEAQKLLEKDFKPFGSKKSLFPIIQTPALQ